jgi:hypothetical protein
VTDADPDEGLLAYERARRSALVAAFAQTARSVAPGAGLSMLG